MSRKRILLVVEGEKQEVSLFRALFACYRLDLEYSANMVDVAQFTSEKGQALI